MNLTYNRHGFTLIEMLVVIAMIGILMAIAVPNYLRAKDKAKEAETKANLHVIQVAVERYATDHMGQYPAYLIGGDERGWRECSAVKNRPPDQRPPKDPLIHLGYLTDYPKNPFVDDGLTDIIDYTGNPHNLQYGSGDVRFGYDGTTMGNTLDDPRLLWSAPGQLSRLQFTFAPDSIYAPNNLEDINPFYTMGGIPDLSGASEADRQSRTISEYWPGQFFYRATGEIILRSELSRDAVRTEVPTIWDAKYSSIDRYVLGAYGSTRTSGMDVIRLTGLDGNTINNVNGQDGGSFYQENGMFGGIPFASPEVFGGGQKGVMPIFPYYTQRDQVRQFIYGAPDGYPDGVIMFYTSEMDSAGSF